MMSQVEVLGGLGAVVGFKNHKKQLVFVGFSISSVWAYIGLSWSYVASPWRPKTAPRQPKRAQESPRQPPGSPERSQRTPMSVPEAAFRDS